MPQRDTPILLQHLPTGWSLYNGGNVLQRYGTHERPHLGEAATRVMAETHGRGYWRETRWKDGQCTQYVWVANDG